MDCRYYYCAFGATNCRAPVPRVTIQLFCLRRRSARASRASSPTEPHSTPLPRSGTRIDASYARIALARRPCARSRARRACSRFIPMRGGRRTALQSKEAECRRNPRSCSRFSSSGSLPKASGIPVTTIRRGTTRTIRGTRAPVAKSPPGRDARVANCARDVFVTSTQRGTPCRRSAH